MNAVSLQSMHGHHPVGWPKLNLEEAGPVLARAGFAVEEARLTWHSERPLSAAAIVDVNGTQVFVKRHHRSIRTVGQLEEEHAFLRHLLSQGAPVSRVHAAADGHTALSAGDYTYEIQEVGAGIDLYRDSPSWTPFKHLEHAEAAGRSLALLHRAAHGYAAPRRQAHVLVSSDRVITASDPLAVIDRYVEQRPQLGAYLRHHPWQADIAQALAPFHASLRPFVDDLRTLWTHNDWHSSNLLWSDAGPSASVRTVLDFGLSDRTTAIFDLATAIERNTIPWIKIQAGEATAADLPLVAGLIRGYSSEARLSQTERKALIAILPIVHVDYALSEIEYFQGVTGSLANADLAYHAFLLRHCHWFTGPDGRVLLDYLRDLLEVRP
jgi:Ser/Thr protein kinase RdoA (MazF antagonist)